MAAWGRYRSEELSEQGLYRGMWEGVGRWNKA